jgi:substrate import-associated zinc metallohydrolase lipoprotein
MKKLNIFVLMLVAVTTLNITSCSDDDFTDTIFPVKSEKLDRSLYTFPLDTFVKVNFQEPYNMRYLYKLQDIGSDMDYNLTPCSYDQCVNLAVLNKYLWYDVYRDVVGDEFLKKYSPRVMHIIGSPAYNPTSGTIKLGTAEGGLKITLYNAESLAPSDLDKLNEYFFKTMHHEFSHILHQNVNYPVDFNLISSTFYNSAGWQDTPDSVSLGQGFVSNYASSQAREDWVETIANYIVKDSITWEGMLDGATKSWELSTDVNYKHWKACDAKVKAGLAHRDSVGYYWKVGTTSGGDTITIQAYRKYIQRNAEGYAVPDANGKIVYLSVVDRSGTETGKDVILKKLQMCREWLKTNFNYDIDKVRDAVQKKQYLYDDKGYLVKDSKGRPINKLTYVRPDGTTLMQELRQMVEKYKALQTTK